MKGMSLPDPYKSYRHCCYITMQEENKNRIPDVFIDQLFEVQQHATFDILKIQNLEQPAVGRGLVTVIVFLTIFEISFPIGTGKIRNLNKICPGFFRYDFLGSTYPESVTPP